MIEADFTPTLELWTHRDYEVMGGVVEELRRTCQPWQFRKKSLLKRLPDLPHIPHDSEYRGYIFEGKEAELVRDALRLYFNQSMDRIVYHEPNESVGQWVPQVAEVLVFPDCSEARSYNRKDFV